MSALVMGLFSVLVLLLYFLALLLWPEKSLDLRGLARRAMRSNLWPVAAYVTGFLWLVLVNVENVPLGLAVTDQAAYYGILGQFDALVHYTVALSLAATAAASLGRRAALGLVVALVLVWEIFEFFTQPFLANLPGITSTPTYLADTMEDIAVGLAGALTGAFFGAEPLSTSDGIE